jgi:hypothetical protein
VAQRCADQADNDSVFQGESPRRIELEAIGDHHALFARIVSMSPARVGMTMCDTVVTTPPTTRMWLPVSYVALAVIPRSPSSASVHVSNCDENVVHASGKPGESGPADAASSSG